MVWSLSPSPEAWIPPGRSSAAPPSRAEWSEWLERLTITALRRLAAAAIL